MSATDEESAIRDRADGFVRSHGKEIVDKFLKGYTSELNPISIFMAGSPGAGKTETSKMLLRNASNLLQITGNMVRIDADELREHFTDCGYNGANSHLFQKAASNLVHRIHDTTLKRKVSFLLDGTFSNESMARQNIQRSLKRKREVFIIFVYQPPQVAWGFVRHREKVEGRRIRTEDFAKKFCESQSVVNKMKAEFGNQATLTLVIKDIDNASQQFFKKSIERIDDHIPERYSEQEIRALIENQPAAPPA